MWPGFGDNLRVLLWIMDRCEGKVDAVETPIGFLPKAEDIDIDGLDVTVDDVKAMLTVDKALWREEADGIEEFFKSLGDTVPQELYDELATLRANVAE